MTPSAKLETIQLLCDLTMLFSASILGAVAFDQQQKLNKLEPEAEFAQQFMYACLNAGDGRGILIDKQQKDGVFCVQL